MAPLERRGNVAPRVVLFVLPMRWVSSSPDDQRRFLLEFQDKFWSEKYCLTDLELINRHDGPRANRHPSRLHYLVLGWSANETGISVP